MIELRTDVYAEAGLRASLFELFDATWRSLRAREEEATRLGFPWSAISTPFTAVDRGRVVAHAGLLALPMIVAGRPLAVGAIHAVCVAADHRGEGLARRVLMAALGECDRCYPAAVLASDKFDLYARFGFAPRPLHRFVGQRPAVAGDARRLDLTAPADRAIWTDALCGRMPLSRRFAVLDRGPVNCFDAALPRGGFAETYHAGALGAVIYAREVDGAVVVDDVIATRPVDGAALLASLPFTAARVDCRFDAGELGLTPEPLPLGPSDDPLMIRGALVDPSVPVAWPTYSFT